MIDDFSQAVQQHRVPVEPYAGSEKSDGAARNIVSQLSNQPAPQDMCLAVRVNAVSQEMKVRYYGEGISNMSAAPIFY